MEQYLIGGPRDGERATTSSSVPADYLPWKFEDYPGLHFAHISLDASEVQNLLEARRQAEEKRSSPIA